MGNSTVKYCNKYLKARKQKVIGLEDDNVTEDLTNKLNEDCLLKLFTFLPRNDIVTMQRVCHSWRAAAQHKSLWNNYTLTLTGDPVDEKNIILMPALRNINGQTQNCMLDVILSNVFELKKLNCDFTPAISSTQAQDVLRKYPEIESIAVNTYSPDIHETIHELKPAGCLKEVVFRGCFEDPYAPSLHRLNSLILFEILDDSLNFPALTNLDLTKFCSDNLEDSTFFDLMAGVIRKRSDQLLYLKCGYEGSVAVPVLNSISVCTKLKKLHLSVFDEPPVSFNLDNVNHLESLRIHSGIGCNNNCPKMVKDIFARRSWAHLLELDISLHCLQQLDILKLIIESSKHLKILKYYEHCYHLYTLNESQLERISSLSKLEILNVAYFETMTQKGLDYLSGCRNLTYLNFIVNSSNIENFLLEVAKMISHMTKLAAFRMYNGSLAVENFNLYDRDQINNFIETYLPV